MSYYGAGANESTTGHSNEKTWGERISDYFVNDGLKTVWILLWVAGNFAVGFERFYHYYWVLRPGPFDTLGHGVTIARSAAACLKLNSALMLVTMLRNFLSWLRTTFIGSLIPVDKMIVFHRYIAWTIALFTTLHIGAHFFNIPKLYDPPEKSFTTIAGSTGVVVTLAMILMYSSAIKYIRGPMFNLFWYTHHLFIIYYGLLCAHGARGLLEPPTFWCWFIGPGFMYFVERFIRLYRGTETTILELAIAHPSKVLELRMKKSSFKYKSGQFLFLNCPYLASQEWHPFTITSAPDEDFVSVHINILGDWTGDLYNFMNPDKKLGVVQENLLAAPDGLPILRIDGPFGAASEDVFGFKTVVLVGGGIGVTPFASILKNIRYKLIQTGTTILEKVYFFWVCRDRNAFEWFADLLAALEKENVNNFLEINTYLTARIGLDEIKTVMYLKEEEQGKDYFTGLRSPCHFGRPDWKRIFEDLSVKHAGQEVGVFLCGPPMLSKTLYKFSRQFTSSKTGTKFHFHKENF